MSVPRKSHVGALDSGRVRGAGGSGLRGAGVGVAGVGGEGGVGDVGVGCELDSG